MIIYTPTAYPMMNLFAPNDVYHLMNAVSSEFLVLSCNDICDWLSELNGATHKGRQQQQQQKQQQQ